MASCATDIDNDGMDGIEYFVIKILCFAALLYYFT